MKSQLITFVLFLFTISIFAQDLEDPSFEEIISLQNVSNALISPDGQHVLFQKQSADWKENSFDSEIWLSKNGDEPFQLTNTANGSSSSPKWSPDGKWIAFLTKRDKEGQIYAIRVEGGEAIQVSNTKQGINGFEWSPDGSQIAFLQAEDKTKENDNRKELYGGFEVEDAEYSKNELWIIPFDPKRFYRNPLPNEMKDTTYNQKFEAQKLLDSVDFTINDFAWSPDGQKIAIDHQPDPLINTFFKADISIYDLKGKSLQTLVQNPSADGFVDWSPDSKSILYQTSLDDSTSNYYLNGHLFRIDIDGRNNEELAQEFDENISRISWEESGIYGIAWQKTKRKLLSIDPDNGEANLIDFNLERVFNFSISDDGQKIAFTGVNDDNLTEVFLADFPLSNVKRLTNSSEQLHAWSMSDSEVISWKSEDGTMIEGVLHKPQNYDPSRKYPLMVVIHGGPTGISVPSAGPSYVYPVVQWLNKGALVLMPNYRGSAGYGEKFRSLNVKNLGVGDAWDVLSGVKYLEEEGIIDGDKVASMGWSQGGYISAFLTTNSSKFKAISVGAGISNWMTYYVNTDIHPFTRQYLKGTPWSDPDVYLKTSPMTNINKASTPTLIQHGEFDKRVPIANAYELFQGLQDVNVETKLIVYKGFGHGITKPKERLAAMWHNWQWFGKYIWEEDIDVPMD
jgi:dipeptidyl aminopeptidase/acylaminoacyl peptidase